MCVLLMPDDEEKLNRIKVKQEISIQINVKMLLEDVYLLFTHLHFATSSSVYHEKW
jgi:hypothetical protein